jgi:hypothetical protein
MKFTFCELASAGTGYLFSDTPDDNGMGGVYKVLNYMTGDNLFTHQLPRAFREVSPEICRQHPFLSNLRELVNSEEDLDARIVMMQGIIKNHEGSTFDLTPLDPAACEHKDPIAEAVEMCGDKVITVQI